MAGTKLLHEWLRDAHGMEKALGDYVDKSIKDFKGNEAVQHDLERIKGQTDAAITTIEDILEERGDRPSGGKDFIGNALGFLTGAGSSAYHDDTVKNILVIHAVFHFAHACYVSLAEGAGQSDDMALSEACNRLSEERRETADWALELVPSLTERALNKSDA